MHIEHIAIWTPHLERLKDFYIRYFGAQANQKYTNPRGFSSYFLRFDDGARLEIMHMAAIPRTENDPIQQATGLTHLAFSLGSQEAVDSLTSRLIADGYSLISAPHTTGDGYYESGILDPDGNRLELTA